MRFARLMRCEFMHAAQHVSPSKEDAIHLNQEGHLRLAEVMADKVKSILG